SDQITASSVSSIHAASIWEQRPSRIIFEHWMAPYDTNAFLHVERGRQAGSGLGKVRISHQT
ncbi:hypothetical protein, partial [Aeromonas veronii]|uniref:hypothetical protein n=1 Tax=Aeromonas veronii TaxID=654 RepID=UPI00214D35F6